MPRKLVLEDGEFFCPCQAETLRLVAYNLPEEMQASLVAYDQYGIIAGEVLARYDGERQRWEIEDLRIALEFRRQGLASHLVSEVLAAALDDVWLLVQPLDGQINHEDLRAFYARFGFRRRGSWMRWSRGDAAAA